MKNTASVEVEEDEIICNCFQVTEGEIRSHIEKNDITEIEDVTSACEAGGECGSCHILIQLFIDQNQHKKVFAKTSGSEVAESENNKKGFWRKLFAGS
ncbi:MAG: (2Fe-2S)-binding protein [Nitrospinaceae bacterium]|jgi:NifU-like protein|nr:(2Fe-2S)-binding protein [Nitrospinaceae bacterium]MDP6712525.1 (2Fe-2S)-binding protein [Nitrospinaceae bacterium]HJN99346.1 (2Fe-2S)-binding protein [Nitrospinaceae bacterium]|tara:strand:- start:114 stop:407 length:294 start_codon:yes stop_codon:yes gene_type:complete